MAARFTQPGSFNARTTREDIFAQDNWLPAFLRVDKRTAGSFSTRENTFAPAEWLPAFLKVDGNPRREPHQTQVEEQRIETNVVVKNETGSSSFAAEEQTIRVAEPWAHRGNEDAQMRQQRTLELFMKKKERHNKEKKLLSGPKLKPVKSTNFSAPERSHLHNI